MELARYRINTSICVNEYNRSGIRDVLLHGKQCLQHDMNLDPGYNTRTSTKGNISQTHIIILNPHTNTRCPARLVPRYQPGLPIPRHRPS